MVISEVEVCVKCRMVVRSTVLGWVRQNGTKSLALKKRVVFWIQWSIVCVSILLFFFTNTSLVAEIEEPWLTYVNVREGSKAWGIAVA